VFETSNKINKIWLKKLNPRIYRFEELINSIFLRGTNSNFH